MNIQEAGAALRARKISSVELTQQCLKAIDRHNPRTNAFITITADSALAEARKADEDLSRGIDRGAMHGIPIALKDLFDTAGIRTTYGSKIFTNHIPERDADIVISLRNAGAVFLGKLGLHEFAYGITSSNPHFGPVRNPWDEERIPGGSSGGSGAAVATGMAYMAMGTDTGGSIRIPASFCGTCGLKPTYGLISTAGCRPLSESLDHMGPLTRRVRDLAAAMAGLAGSFSTPTRDNRLQRVRVGIPENFFFDHALPEVRKAVDQAKDAAHDAGAELVSVKVNAIEELVELALVIILAEGADSASDVLDQRADIGADVLARFDQGKAQPLEKYLQAQRRRVEASRRFLKVFEECNVLLTPATPTPAPKIGETKLELDGKEFDLRLATTRLARPINLIGIPALSLPGGLTSDKLPIGLQLLACAGNDQLLVDVGAAIEDRLAPIIPTWDSLAAN